ncbi:hypothetical protein Dda_8570 [Drechslerella dactyloides]|uniref:Uncharacterized protein n=1 Tax=Drechslerella dactyloides TaxID=74499 RepID=A0AAD6NFY6_DREDA|nr:hypothetical protein Dda_8570 [Drechslerella dactyloides]
MTVERSYDTIYNLLATATKNITKPQILSASDSIDRDILTECSKWDQQGFA